jgi:hypothetical protein
LTDEHIIPFGLGGRWVLPGASCKRCAAITGSFEGTVQRTMLGPLRLFYSLPTRRPKDRPEKLPLKVRVTPASDWSFVDVDQDVYPFLVLFPLLEVPDELSGDVTEGERGAKAKRHWIRIASVREWQPHLESLCQELRVTSIEPTGTVRVPEFIRMIAKIGHAYAVARLGPNAFSPFLPSIILGEDLSNVVQFIGGNPTDDPSGRNLHELNLGLFPQDPGLVAVSIRLFAVLGTPTYFVAVGRR